MRPSHWVLSHLRPESGRRHHKGNGCSINCQCVFEQKPWGWHWPSDHHYKCYTIYVLYTMCFGSYSPILQHKEVQNTTVVTFCYCDSIKFLSKRFINYPGKVSYWWPIGNHLLQGKILYFPANQLFLGVTLKVIDKAPFMQDKPRHWPPGDDQS